jgi:hypothetical protein
MPHKDPKKARAYRQKPENRAKEVAAAAEWRKNNPEKYAEAILRYNLAKHGLTIEEYNELLVKQNGVCAICHEAEISRQRLSVDHDHLTGKVRALLCIRCNCLLGYARDSIQLLLAAVDYLKRHVEKPADKLAADLRRATGCELVPISDEEWKAAHGHKYCLKPYGQYKAECMRPKDHLGGCGDGLNAA